MKRYYYAFEHRYGAHMQDTSGRNVGKVMIFTSKRLRDIYVEMGQYPYNDAREREAITYKEAQKYDRYYE